MRSNKTVASALAALSIAAAAAVSLAPGDASAFCGFYVSGADAKLFNNATQVVLMREGTRVVLSMQNNYQGPPSDFAMVVPVPIVLQQDNVKTLPREIFDRVDRLGAPRLVEYWEENPCAVQKPKMATTGMPVVRKAEVTVGGRPADLGVTVEAKFTVGEYQVVILSAKDSTGLDTWLRQEKYKIPEGAEPYLRPYVVAGMKFFVAKVDVAKVKFQNGMAMLSPLRFHYDSELFSLPVRLGLMNSAGTQDLIINILAQGTRYEVANYANVTIPTNIDVADKVRNSFPAFYAALFDRAMAKHPKAVVTEYAWDAGTCDPCPLPALTPSEIMTLGGDVFPREDAAGGASPSGSPGGSGPPIAWRRGRRGLGFVLTRLHARYTKDALGEDLVFRAAEPIAGGREFLTAQGKLERGFVKASVNNFQSRYAIRHPWTGPITCKNPVRGVWGPPPPSVTEGRWPMPATNLAFAPRGGEAVTAFVKAGAAIDPGFLASAVAVPVTIAPGINPPSSGAPDAGVEDSGAPPEGADAGPADAGALPPTSDAGPTAPQPPPVPPESGGCAGCEVAAESGGAAFGFAAAGVAVLSAWLRKRRRR